MQTRLTVRNCQEADREHAISRRQYAHTFHRPGVICVSRSFWDLPETNRLGLLLHEAGHVLMERVKHNHTEDEANDAIYHASGIRVWYRDGNGGPQLEWIRPEDKRKAREFLGI